MFERALQYLQSGSTECEESDSMWYGRTDGETSKKNHFVIKGFRLKQVFLHVCDCPPKKSGSISRFSKSSKTCAYIQVTNTSNSCRNYNSCLSETKEEVVIDVHVWRSLKWMNRSTKCGTSTLMFVSCFSFWFAQSFKKGYQCNVLKKKRIKRTKIKLVFD